MAWANRECDYSLQCQWWNPHKWTYYGTRFHFWPAGKDLICCPDSELSRRIIENVKEEEEHIISEIVCNAGNRRKLDEYWLCALGVALHGLQDTFFHQNWIGKFSRHNCLPVWSKGQLSLSIPFPYGHSAMDKVPDVANATWYDPRTGGTIKNIERTEFAIGETAKVLGLGSFPMKIMNIFWEEPEYEARKQALRELAGVPKVPFSQTRKEMLAKYGKPFFEAAAAQAKIVKEYLDDATMR